MKHILIGTLIAVCAIASIFLGVKLDNDIVQEIATIIFIGSICIVFGPLWK